MQLQHPFATVTPTVDGDVLTSLASTSGSMTLAEILQRVPGRSYAGVRNSAARLVAQGVVTESRVGRTKTFALNREHLAAGAVEVLAGQREEFLRRLRAGCETIPLRFAAVFGSAARGTMRADSDSDIDICFVTTGPDRPAAEAGVHDLCAAASRWTGNAVHPVLFDEDDIDPLDPLLRSVEQDGVLIAGDGRWLSRRLRTLAG